MTKRRRERPPLTPNKDLLLYDYFKTVDYNIDKVKMKRLVCTIYKLDYFEKKKKPFTKKRVPLHAQRDILKQLEGLNKEEVEALLMFHGVVPPPPKEDKKDDGDKKEENKEKEGATTNNNDKAQKKDKAQATQG